MPESQGHASVGSQAVSLQRVLNCTQFTSHCNQGVVAVRGRAGIPSAVAQEETREELQTRAGYCPQPYQKRVILGGIFTAFAERKSCCNALSSSLERCPQRCCR